MPTTQTSRVPSDCEWVRDWFPVDSRDVLHQSSDLPVEWTTVNLGEVFPGVPTPLNWAVLGSAGEYGLRRALRAIGTYRRCELSVPNEVSRRTINIMCGRAIANLDVFRNFADRTPGTSGDAMEAQIFGSSLTIGSSHRDLSRYLIVLFKMPLAAFRRRRTMLLLRRDIDRWWHATIFAEKKPSRLEATRLLWDAHRRITKIFDPHNVVMMVALSVFMPVRKLAAREGLEGLESKLLFTGDTEESGTVADLWEVSRDRLPLREFVARHGFHGPQENELSSRVWREDDAPLASLILRYRNMDDAASPLAGVALRMAAREEAERRLLAGLSRLQRIGLRVLLWVARRYVPLREVGRHSFLKGMDVVRFAARIIGADLQRLGLIDSAEDAFYLTPVELTELPDGLRERVAYRRERRIFYQSVSLPERWRGAATPRAPTQAARAERVAGIGVSAGIAEGLVRVVLDPSDDELEQGEILVCRTTDPGWASYFFMAAGVVIDIGGALSHGAIIARELGLPCVINARDATEHLHTGDRVRVDGTTGTVDILERCLKRQTA